MLIICPECNKEISDKAENCIHCGFPLSQIPHGNICIIDGVPHDLTEQLENLNNPNYKPFKKFGEWGMSIRDAGTLHDILEQTHSVPKEYNSCDTEKYRQELSKMERENNKLKCPKCKSTSIATGARGVNFTWGLIGASKTVNRCSNCGHTWKP